MSGERGFTSCSLVLYIAEKEIIKELYVTTLRVGKKELEAICNLKDEGRLKKAYFVLSGISKYNYYKGKRYDYDTYFEDACNDYKFKYDYVNNHSKIILARTSKNYYVIETSSNFNENPKIEQFCLLNSKEVYEYYLETFRKVGIFNE